MGYLVRLTTNGIITHNIDMRMTRLCGSHIPRWLLLLWGMIGYMVFLIGTENPPLSCAGRLTVISPPGPVTSIASVFTEVVRSKNISDWELSKWWPYFELRRPQNSPKSEVTLPQRFSIACICKWATENLEVITIDSGKIKTWGRTVLTYRFTVKKGLSMIYDYENFSCPVLKNLY